MKKKIRFITGLSLLCLASPLTLRAGAGAAADSTNVEEFLASHPRAKERVLEKFDKNHNGVLDPDELAAFKAAREKRHEKMLAKFDTNHDGVLEPDEKAAAKEKLKQLHKKHQNETPTPASPAAQAQ